MRFGDVDVDQAGVGEGVLGVFVVGEGAGDATDVLLHVGTGCVVHIRIGDYVADREGAARLEHSCGFSQDLRFVGWRG